VSERNASRVRKAIVTTMKRAGSDQLIAAVAVAISEYEEVYAGARALTGEHAVAAELSEPIIAFACSCETALIAAEQRAQIPADLEELVASLRESYGAVARSRIKPPELERMLDPAELEAAVDSTSFADRGR